MLDDLVLWILISSAPTVWLRLLLRNIRCHRASLRDVKALSRLRWWLLLLMNASCLKEVRREKLALRRLRLNHVLLSLGFWGSTFEHEIVLQCVMVPENGRRAITLCACKVSLYFLRPKHEVVFVLVEPRIWWAHFACWCWLMRVTRLVLSLFSCLINLLWWWRRSLRILDDLTLVDCLFRSCTRNQGWVLLLSWLNQASMLVKNRGSEIWALALGTLMLLSLLWLAFFRACRTSCDMAQRGLLTTVIS